MQRNRRGKKPIWITWESQRRNREIAKRIGADLYEWDQIDRINNPIRKYTYGLFKTVILLLKVKPNIVFCQNPSIILSLFVCISAKLFPFEAVVDAHNAGLFPLEGRSKILMGISKLTQKLAFLTIVTNEALKVRVQKNGGTAFVLPDPIPEFAEIGKTYSLGHSFNTLFICSFAEDEPYENVFEAADILNDSYHIYVTGNYKKKFDYPPARLAGNITLLGFVPETEFTRFLHSVDITIDLTNRENCLVCGAYESVAAEKPMIISDTKSLRDYFDKGAVYTDNSADSIAQSIKIAKDNYSRLKEEIRVLKTAKQAIWCELLDDLRKAI